MRGAGRQESGGGGGGVTAAATPREGKGACEGWSERLYV